MTDEPYDQLVLQAVHSLRHLGAAPEVIRGFVKLRSPQHGGEDDLAALRRLRKQGAVDLIGTRWFLNRELEAQAFSPASPPAWQSEDSWILLALFYETRPWRASTLAGLIGKADMINHAIPTLDELHGALNRLASAGLIEAHGATYKVTGRARDLHAKVKGRFSARMLEKWNRLHRLLSGVALEAVRWQIDLTAAEYGAACARYSARFDSWVQPAPSGRRRTPTARRPRVPLQVGVFSRFARYGLIWACCGPALLATLVIFQPPVPAGLAKAILLSYLAIGFGLLASFPIRYMVRRFRKKGARREPLQVGLWDQELDSCGPDPSAKLG